MKKLKISYPWDKIAEGESFFVPAVDPAKVKHEGLVAALHLRIKATAKLGLYNGKHGVLFTKRLVTHRGKLKQS